MTKPTKDGFSTSVHLALMNGVDETRQRTFSALDCLSQKYHDPRAELLESYDVTEDDVRKYYSDWEKLRNS